MHWSGCFASRGPVVFLGSLLFLFSTAATWFSGSSGVECGCPHGEPSIFMLARSRSQRSELKRNTENFPLIP